MAECVVCLEGIVKKGAVICPQCDTGIHPSCVQQHLLHTVLDPHCPNCRQAWSHDFLAKHLSKSWRMGVFKTHRENVLMDREKSLLPETQDAAAEVVLTRRYNAALHRTLEEMNPLKTEYKIIRSEMYRILFGEQMDTEEDDRRIVELLAKKRPLRERINYLEQVAQAIRNRQYDLDTKTIRLDMQAVAPIADKRREFIYPCPAPDCRGFLSTQWKCKICSEFTCSNCGELRGRDHECDEAVKASFELIRKDSKPCPHCGVPITKISGCDHMFCVDCKTSFSWKTGEIHPKGNSNPLYWQWIQQNGSTRAPAPQPGDPCTNTTIIANLRTKIGKHTDHPSTQKVVQLLDSLPHIEMIDLRSHLDVLARDEFRPMRISYILKEISEADWRVNIQRIDKKRRKAQYIANILELFVRGSIDILRKLEDVKPGPIKLNQLYGEASTAILPEIAKLAEICNLELMKIKTIFSSTVCLIDDDFHVVNIH